MDIELEKLKSLTKTLTSNGYLTDQTVAWEYAFNSVNELVCITNPSYKIKFLNRPFLSKLGKDPKKDHDLFLNRSIDDIFLHDPFDVQQRKVSIDDSTAFDYGESYIPEFDGWYSKRRYVIQNNCKRIIGYTYMLTDITARKKAEEDLLQSEHRFRQLFKHLACAAIVFAAIDHGNNYVIIDANNQALTMDNISEPTDIIGKSLLNLLPTAKEIGLIDKLKEVYTTGHTAHIPTAYYSNNCLTGWRDCFIFKLPSEEIVMLYTDETERVTAQKEVKDSKVLLEGVLNAIPDAIAVQDITGDYLACNEAGQDTFKLTSKEVDNKKFYVPSEITEIHSVCQADVCKGTKKPTKSEIYINSLKGWYDCRAYPILDEDDNVDKVIEHIRDITEIKHNQKQKESYYSKMTHAYNRLYFIVSAVDGYIWEKEATSPNKEFTHTYVDPKFCSKFYHIQPSAVDNDGTYKICKESFGKTGSELIDSYTKRGKRHTFGNMGVLTDNHCIEQGKPCEYFEMGYIEQESGTTDWFIMRVRKTPVFNSLGECTGVLGFANDCTFNSREIKKVIDTGLKTGHIEKLDISNNEARAYWIIERPKDKKELTHLDFP